MCGDYTSIKYDQKHRNVSNMTRNIEKYKYDLKYRNMTSGELVEEPRRRGDIVAGCNLKYPLLLLFCNLNLNLKQSFSGCWLWISGSIWVSEWLLIPFRQFMLNFSVVAQPTWRSKARTIGSSMLTLWKSQIDKFSQVDCACFVESLLRSSWLCWFDGWRILFIGTGSRCRTSRCELVARETSTSIARGVLEYALIFVSCVSTLLV